MPYEHPTTGGVPRLSDAGCRWSIEFNGRRRSPWISSNEAVSAAVRHSTGSTLWDRSRLAVSNDLLRWRPIGENL